MLAAGLQAPTLPTHNSHHNHPAFSSPPPSSHAAHSRDARVCAAAAHAQGNTALHLAAINGHAAAVRALLAGGAPLGAANGEGKVAAQLAKTDEVRQLLQPAA